MGLPLTSPSDILVSPRLHFMVIDLTRKASSRPQRRYKPFMNVNPPGKDRGEKFSRDDRLPFQVHTPVCITHETAERLNKN